MEMEQFVNILPVLWVKKSTVLPYLLILAMQPALHYP